MSEFVLVEVADDGSVNATKLTDPVQVTQTVTIPLATLFPETVASGAGAEAPTGVIAPPADETGPANV